MDKGHDEAGDVVSTAIEDRFDDREEEDDQEEEKDRKAWNPFYVLF